MKKYILVISFYVFAQCQLCAFSVTDFTSRVDKFLYSMVKNGRVNYAGIKSAPTVLNGLVEEISTASMSGLNSKQKKAFYLNAYNILVIKGIVKNYHVEGPLKIKGFFDEIKYEIAGERLSLNEIENKKIRKVYHDSRIHFALVCAAVGCPTIMAGAYKAPKLDQQLNERTKYSLNSKYFIRVNKAQQKVEISEIFKWYQQDFLDEEKDIITYLNKFRSDKIPHSYELNYYSYDWSLNSL